MLVHPLHRNSPQQQQRTTKDRDDVRCHALVLRAKGDKGTLVKGTLNGLIETKKVELSHIRKNFGIKTKRYLVNK